VEGDSGNKDSEDVICRSGCSRHRTPASRVARAPAVHHNSRESTNRIPPTCGSKVQFSRWPAMFLTGSQPQKYLDYIGLVEIHRHNSSFIYINLHVDHSRLSRPHDYLSQSGHPPRTSRRTAGQPSISITTWSYPRQLRQRFCITNCRHLASSWLSWDG